jgi:hypothetical protein
MAPPAFSLAASNVAQMVGGPTPGRGRCTRFGDYWIVPDNTHQCYEDVAGEQITETEFAVLQADWNALVGGTGNILISESDNGGTAHAGFRENVLTQLGLLMSAPNGRVLVTGLIHGSQVVTIRPMEGTGGIAESGTSPDSIQNDDGSPNIGGTTTVYLSDSLTDDTAVAFDADGNELASPVFIMLGHELVHAVHNAAGINQRNAEASSTEWVNREEEVTIAGPDLSENTLRAEHGLGERHGHGHQLVNP